nr:hypothetical protein [Streptococcus agalactiae]
MSYKVITSSETVRDIEEAVFYKEGLGVYPGKCRKIQESCRFNYPKVSGFTQDWS